MKTCLPAGVAARLVAGLVLAAMAGCSVLPDKPIRPLVYDFGSGLPMPSDTASLATPLPAIALAEVGTTGQADTAAMTYRLQYTDAQQLRPYALARWALPTAQLVQQRMRERLGLHRPVLDVDAGLAQKRVDGRLPRILRLQLEEFSQVFASPARSEGVLRLRATLVDNTAEGESLVGQRMFVVHRPAATGDASGGVRALTLATDAAADEVEAWLASMAPAPR